MIIFGKRRNPNEKTAGIAHLARALAKQGLSKATRINLNTRMNRALNSREARQVGYNTAHGAATEKLAALNAFQQRNRKPPKPAPKPQVGQVPQQGIRYWGNLLGQGGFGDDLRNAYFGKGVDGASGGMFWNTHKSNRENLGDWAETAGETIGSGVGALPGVALAATGFGLPAGAGLAATGGAAGNWYGRTTGRYYGDKLLDALYGKEQPGVNNDKVLEAIKPSLNDAVTGAMSAWIPPAAMKTSLKHFIPKDFVPPHLPPKVPKKRPVFDNTPIDDNVKMVTLDSDLEESFSRGMDGAVKNFYGPTWYSPSVSSASEYATGKKPVLIRGDKNDFVSTLQIRKPDSSKENVVLNDWRHSPDPFRAADAHAANGPGSYESVGQFKPGSQPRYFVPLGKERTLREEWKPVIGYGRIPETPMQKPLLINESGEFVDDAGKPALDSYRQYLQHLDRSNIGYTPQELAGMMNDGEVPYGTGIGGWIDSKIQYKHPLTWLPLFSPGGTALHNQKTFNPTLLEQHLKKTKEELPMKTIHSILSQQGTARAVTNLEENQEDAF
jgi:hypothetical protein